MNIQLPFDFDLKTAAYLVVDLQNDFVRANAPLNVPDAVTTLESVKRIKGLFRAAGRPVIFTRFVAGPAESLLWTWSPQLREPVNCCKLGHVRYYDDIKAEREVVAIVDELDFGDTDIVVDKFWYGAFHRTNLQDILAAYNVDTVVVVGTVTQICVEETAREALHFGYKTIILADCVSSFDPDLQRASLKNLNMKFGAVITSEQLVTLAR